MRELIRDKERLEHILSAIDVLEVSRTRYTYQEAVADPIVYYGFVKHIEIIGEAVYMLTKEFKQAHRDLNWDDIERMRHVLVHGYYKIKPNQLWDTVLNDIPPMRQWVERYIEELS